MYVANIPTAYYTLNEYLRGLFSTPPWRPAFSRYPAISNGNSTEWSPIRSVIIRVINKIGRPRSGSPICLITSMITDRIGRHKVLLPINHKYNKIREKI